MATWFRLPKALVGVSNKAGSSTMRRIASGKFKEYDPRSARAHALRECVPSFLILRDPVERAESAYNYFAGLGWPRMSGVGFRSIAHFFDHLTGTKTSIMDPHWRPQKEQHETGGSQWWDYELPFEVASEVIFGAVHENKTERQTLERFSLSQRLQLLDGPYHLDMALPPKRLDRLARHLVF